LLGGYLVEHYTWRWVFYVNVPVAVVATVCAVAFIPRGESDSSRSFEWVGFSALMVLVASLNLCLSRGQRLDWLDSAEIRIEFTIAALALVVVIVRTLFIQNSFLERRLFADRNYLVSMNVMLLFGALVSLPLILLPLMLQQVFGYPAMSAGALMVARGVGLTFTMLIVGLLRGIDPRLVLAFGFVCAAIANLYMATWSIDIDPWSVVWTNLLLGVSAGATFVPMVTIALATVQRSLHTEALTFLFLVTNTGKALGVAGIFVLHTRLQQINHAVLSENVSLTNERLRQLAIPESWDLASPGGLASLSIEVDRQAELIAYLNDFLVIGIICLCILPLIAFLKRPPAADK
jgi:DHA2 family multidrug resistance protein